ncbi:uncharacterized protein ACIB01_001555 isoform 2-T2 [Guaruba guarouba]
MENICACVRKASEGRMKTGACKRPFLALLSTLIRGALPTGSLKTRAPGCTAGRVPGHCYAACHSRQHLPGANSNRVGSSALGVVLTERSADTPARSAEIRAWRQLLALSSLQRRMRQWGACPLLSHSSSGPRTCGGCAISTAKRVPF